MTGDNVSKNQNKTTMSFCPDRRDSSQFIISKIVHEWKSMTCYGSPIKEILLHHQLLIFHTIPYNYQLIKKWSSVSDG